MDADDDNDALSLIARDDKSSSSLCNTGLVNCISEADYTQISMSKLTVQDIIYFQESMSFMRKLTIRTLFTVGNNAEYMKECNRWINCVNIGIKAGLSKCLEMEQNLIMPDYLEYIKDITGINNYKVLQEAGHDFKAETDIYTVFSSLFNQDMTFRETLMETGINPEQLAYLSKPLHNLLDLKNPNILDNCSDFTSPWAVSEDLETFFHKTAQAFRFCQDSVVFFIFYQLLALSSRTREIQESYECQRRYSHLKMILYKHYYKKTRSVIETDMRVSKIISLIDDLRLCSAIYQTSNIKATAHEVTDIDKIQIQHLEN